MFFVLLFVSSFGRVSLEKEKNNMQNDMGECCLSLEKSGGWLRKSKKKTEVPLGGGHLFTLFGVF